MTETVPGDKYINVKCTVNVKTSGRLGLESVTLQTSEAQFTLSTHWKQVHRSYLSDQGRVTVEETEYLNFVIPVWIRLR